MRFFFNFKKYALHNGKGFKNKFGSNDIQGIHFQALGKACKFF